MCFLVPSGLHEQHLIWQWEDRLLWDSCWWSRGGTNLERAEWSSQSYDQHPHHWPRDSGEEVKHAFLFNIWDILFFIIIVIKMLLPFICRSDIPSFWSSSLCGPSQEVQENTAVETASCGNSCSGAMWFSLYWLRGDQPAPTASWVNSDPSKLFAKLLLNCCHGQLALAANC